MRKSKRQSQKQDKQKANTTELKAQLILDENTVDELCDEEEEEDFEELEADFFDPNQPELEFLKDWALMKPLNGKNFTR